MFDSISDDSLMRLRPGDVRAYALQHGWLRAGTFKNKLAIFNRNDGGLDQLLVPLADDLSDYTSLMRTVIAKFVEAESRKAAVILNDLLSVYADTVRYSIRSLETARGTVPLIRGIDLLDGARRSLLSAACTVLAPESSYHPRMSRSEADEFIQACELGQTEHSSFTVAIRCPLNAVEAVEPENGVEAEPFARRATTTLVQSATALAAAIDDDQVDRLVAPQDALPHITANLCEALLRMQPSTEQSALALSVAWAPSRPRPADENKVVLFRSDHFEKIEWLYRQLRPAPARQAAPFVGYVDELRGTIAADGRRAGEVRLSVIHEDELIKVRVRLSSDEYQTASEAHMEGTTVVVTGLLERRPRLSVIGDIVRFEKMELVAA